MRKTFFLLAVVAILAAPAAFAAGAKEQTTAPTAMTGPVTFPLKEKVTLNILGLHGTPIEPKNDMPLFKEITRLTGVELNIDYVPHTGNVLELYATKILSGVDKYDYIWVPDIVNGTRLVRDGSIIALQDLIPRYAPEMVKWWETHPVERSAFYFTEERKIYWIPWGLPGNHFIWNTLAYRPAFAQARVTKDPDTFEEFYATLRQLKNGGVQYPYAGMWGMYNGLMTVFGLHVPPNGGRAFYPDRNGVVGYEYINPKMREYYAYMNRLYREGLLDPEFDINDQEKVIAKLSRNNIGILTTWTSVAFGFNAALNLGTDKVGLTLMAPPAGPYGDRWIMRILPFEPNSGYAITRASKRPDVALAFLTWTLTSREFWTLNNWGIEGTTYNVVGGKKQRPAGYTPEALQRIGGANRLYPVLDGAITDTDAEEMYSNLTAADRALIDSNKVVQRYFTVNEFPNNNMISDTQRATEARLVTDIDTYVAEMRLKFIKGETPLDQWDSYVARLKSLGIEELIKINQTRYDNFVKVVGKPL